MQELMDSSLPGYVDWSEEQVAIFDWFREGSGNLLARARAGTGKTTTICQAIFYAPEEKILVAAFNKSIQEELNRKLRNRRAQAKTLHGLGFALVKKNWPDADVDSTGARANGLVCQAVFALWAKLFPEAAVPATIDDIDFNDTIVRHMAKVFTSTRDIAPFAATEEDVMDVIFDQDLVPEMYLENQGWTPLVLARVTLKAMELALVRTKVIDFADMVYLPLRLNWTRGVYDMVCVDEAQDMNAGQLELAKRVCKPKGRIAIIGDDRQAIYGFRGAASGSLDMLKQELNAKELSLTVTFRCPTSVVEYAQRLVPDIKAKSGAPLGSISSVAAADLYKHVKPGDFVLSRSNAPLAKAALSLIRQGVRAKIVGRDIGQRLSNIARKLKAYDVMTFYTKLGDWARREIDRAKKANRKGRIQLVCDQADTLRALLFGLNDLNMLYKRIDEMFGDVSASYVQCSSVHKAKGLEADRVYVLQDTLYAGKGGKDKQEEQNIEYVAVTRAKNALIWVNGFNPPKKFKSTAPQPWEDERWKNPPWEVEDFDDEPDDPR